MGLLIELGICVYSLFGKMFLGFRNIGNIFLDIINDFLNLVIGSTGSKYF